MSLQDVQDELKAQLAEINGEEAEEEVVDDVVEEEATDEVVEETTEEDQEETTDEEAKVEDDEKVEDPELDSTGYAKLRRELAAEKKLRAEAEAKLVNPDAKAVEVDQSEVVNQEVNDLLQERRLQKASQEFADLEEGFKANVPDYDGISNAYKSALYQSIRMQNPRKTHVQLLEDTRNTLLYKANGYINSGLDPIQELYEEAKSLGITPVAAETEAKAEVLKPNLSNVAKNKAKNAGMVAAKGSGAGGQLTREGAVDLTAGEWSKLSAGEKARLLSNG